ncbi:hypothetical protein VMCG_10850 [Cytospora schulzeri]|uniref:Terpene synthase n=1 Tax=Cytospora schulzeri TaxID=448051 RepID=A0A423V7N4_9PEZI|nr:hypothetical protein VMCG_10850 [Valsa malicola]
MSPPVANPIAATSRVNNEREALLSSIKGQIITIPDLKPDFNDWKGIQSRHVSPWLEPLREKVRTRLEIFDFDKAKRDRLEAADFALFTSLWWPDTPSLAHSEILAYLVIWLFTWDDEIDEPTGAYTDDARGAQTYRDHTLQFVGACLGLHEHGFRPQNRIVQSFDAIGNAMSASYDLCQRQRFFDEIARFMMASEAEQVCRLHGRLFTLEEYWQVRMGTSAVYIGSAAGEFSMGCSSPLPLEVMQCSAMKALWDETNIIISITNDLLSLRKEMKLGCIDSIVPLTFAVTKDLQVASSAVLTSLRASKKRFDEAASMLSMGDSSWTEVESGVQKQIERFIQVQRSNCP